MSQEEPTDHLAFAKWAINTYREELQKELARSSLGASLGAASASAGAAAINSLGMPASAISAALVATPVVAPVTVLGLIPALFAKGSSISKTGNTYKELAARAKSKTLDKAAHRSPAEAEEIAVKIDKNAFDATIDYIDKFKNVELFLPPKPTTKVTKAQTSEQETETNPLTVTGPQTFTHRLRDYCEQHGCSSEQADFVLKFAGPFAEAEMHEEFRVLSAARDLRTQFHLTPKPSVPWGQRKKLGGEVILRDVLGNYAPDLPFRDKSLADLNHEEWWTAFYKEDAEAGRINDQYFKDNDAAFRRGFAKSLGQGSLSSIIHPTDHEARLSSLAEILGTDQSEKAQRFVIPGNTRSRPQTSFTKSA